MGWGREMMGPGEARRQKRLIFVAGSRREVMG